MAIKKKPYKYVSSIEGTSPKLKGLVVSAARARWKENHSDPKERTIRLLRFIWMRRGTLTFDDRHKFHSYELGRMLAQGLARWEQRKGLDLHLVVTQHAYETYLKE